MHNIGFKIKKIRELKNFTQVYMASQLDISQNAYSKIENEACKLDINRFIEISKILNVCPKKIINFDVDQLLN